MKISEIRQKNKGELEKLLMELRTKIRQLKFDIATKQVKNVRELRNVRRDAAKVITVLSGTK